MRIRKALAVAVLAVAVGGVLLFGAGAWLDAQMRKPGSGVIRKLPARSDYLRSLRQQRVDDVGIVTMKTVEAMELAGQRMEAEALARFYAQCNLDRFLGEDGACRKLTLDAALGERWAVSAEVPAERTLEAKLANVLSAADTDAARLRRSVRRPEDYAADAFSNLGKGIWMARRRTGAELYVAVKNDSEWTLTDFEMGIALLKTDPKPRPGASPEFYVYCDRGSDRIAESRPLPPGEITVMYCSTYREDERIAEVLDAVARTHAKGVPFIRPEWITLQNPFVKVTDRRDDDGPPFLVSSLDRRTLSDAVHARQALQKDLRTLDCRTTATCPSPIETVALGLYRLVAR